MMVWTTADPPAALRKAYVKWSVQATFVAGEGGMPIVTKDPDGSLSHGDVLRREAAIKQDRRFKADLRSRKNGAEIDIWSAAGVMADKHGGKAKHAIRGGLGEDGVSLDPEREQLGLSMREAVANLAASNRVSELPANS